MSDGRVVVFAATHWDARTTARAHGLDTHEWVWVHSPQALHSVREHYLTAVGWPLTEGDHQLLAKAKKLGMAEFAKPPSAEEKLIENYREAVHLLAEEVVRLANELAEARGVKSHSAMGRRAQVNSYRAGCRCEACVSAIRETSREAREG